MNPRARSKSLSQNFGVVMMCAGEKRVDPMHGGCGGDPFEEMKREERLRQNKSKGTAARNH